jgi:TetR/AcrR family transcriptional regulator
MVSKLERPVDTVRSRRAASDDVRHDILEAAATEFSEHGFEGASTRRIAEAAGVFQAQIGYHVGNKLELWKSTVDFLFDRLRSHLERALPNDLDRPVDDPVEVFATVIRQHVAHTAKHPELSRVMLMEAARKSERSTWLVKNHVRPTLTALELVWDEVRAAGRGRHFTVADVFLFMIGLAPIPFAQAGIMRPLLGADRCSPERHADVMIEWILG